MMTTHNTDTMNEETSPEIGMVENKVMFHQYNDRPISAGRVQQLIKRLNEGGKIGREGEKKTCDDSAEGGNAKEEERSVGYKMGEDESESMEKGMSDE
jgi:hypothetical protein